MYRGFYQFFIRIHTPLYTLFKDFYVFLGNYLKLEELSKRRIKGSRKNAFGAKGAESIGRPTARILGRSTNSSDENKKKVL